MANKQAPTLRELFLSTLNPENKINGLKEAKEIFWQIQKLESAIDRTTSLMKLTKENVKNSLFYGVTYLFVFEGIYVSCVNSLIYALVCYGHDLYNPNRDRHQYADTPERIASVDIELKFRFLEKHGFYSIVLRDCQRIRNKIAHNDFKYLEGSSKVVLNIGSGEKTEKQYDLKEELFSLLDFSTNFIQGIEELLNTLPHHHQNNAKT